MNNYTAPIHIDLHTSADFQRALFGKSPSQLLLEIRPLPISILRREGCCFPPRPLRRTVSDQAIPIHLTNRAEIKPEELHKIICFGQFEASTTLGNDPAKLVPELLDRLAALCDLGTQVSHTLANDSHRPGVAAGLVRYLKATSPQIGWCLLFRRREGWMNRE